MHLLQSSTRTEAIPPASCSARLGFSCKLRAALQEPRPSASGPKLCLAASHSGSFALPLLCGLSGGASWAGRAARGDRLVRVVAAAPGRSEQHVGWRKARTEAVAVAVVVCCVLVGSDILLLFLFGLTSMIELIEFPCV